MAEQLNALRVDVPPVCVQKGYASIKNFELGTVCVVVGHRITGVRTDYYPGNGPVRRGYAVSIQNV